MTTYFLIDRQHIGLSNKRARYAVDIGNCHRDDGNGRQRPPVLDPCGGLKVQAPQSDRKGGSAPVSPLGLRMPTGGGDYLLPSGPHPHLPLKNFIKNAFLRSPSRREPDSKIGQVKPSALDVVTAMAMVAVRSPCTEISNEKIGRGYTYFGSR
ncbi:hypothetical protein EVAR_30539_1 [Eumeta japonica]|uniref:Uncharacterized protein n=1 Tax=Eumeta variegata TaxID=151549 RepID=A0A4C1VP90_EUMVA|nr:hypothetical protein EVAR_30539_1 [Eumeta japonica]